MNPEFLRSLLEDVRRGALGIEEAMGRLRALPFEDLGFAKVDHHRSLRTGLPEVVLAEGKSAEQVAEVAARIARQGCNVLVTRLDAEKVPLLEKALPGLRYDPQARLGTLVQQAIRRTGVGTIAVVTAGTSDIPVGEEAAVTAELMGNPVQRVFDVGVAGIHRLFAHREVLEGANVLVVVAGMEGALPSVVGGMVDRPVIAVPTSVGYGANFGGLAALLAMLNSCAPGVTVVNIDNGFGAGVAASLINRSRAAGSAPSVSWV